MALQKPYILNQIDTINNTVASHTSQLTEITHIVNDYVNVLDYGAKLDGITDDSLAFTNALNDGNVSVPPGSRIYIGNTVQISDPQRIINGNESVFIGANNVIMFQIGTQAMTQSLLNIKFKDMFVITNKSSFCLSYNSYFIDFENVRLSGLTESNYGVRVVNGFNITFKNFHITGASSSVANISGNNAKGIIIETDSTVNANVIGTSNITNVLIDSCLIQRVEYGVYLNNAGNTTYDTNKINNIGFSHCDNAIHTNTNKCYNLQIKLVRGEYCGTLFTNNGQISIEDVYCYHTTYSFLNGTDGYIILSSMYYHWNDTQGYLIKSNDGIISFKGLTYFERTGATVYAYETSLGRIIQRISPYKTTYTVNTQQSLYIDPFTINTYDQQAYLDFANITGNEGSEFYIFSSNGSNFLLPNGTYQQNSSLGNIMLHCKIINATVRFIGEQALVSKLTVAGGITGTAKQAINIVEITANLTQFNFNNTGLTIIYAKTAGITLSNGNANILNFSSLNGGSAVDLNNNPLLMIPFSDGTGKGLAIKC